MKKYYIDIDKNGNSVGVPWEYKYDTDLDAAMETTSDNAISLDIGTKQKLMKKYGLCEQDFDED